MQIALVNLLDSFCFSFIQSDCRSDAITSVLAAVSDNTEVPCRNVETTNEHSACNTVKNLEKSVLE